MRTRPRLARRAAPEFRRPRPCRDTAKPHAPRTGKPAGRHRGRAVTDARPLRREPRPAPPHADPCGAAGWQLEARARDVDEIARSQSGWQLEYSQLSGGAYVGGLQHIQLEGLRLVREWANRGLRQRGQLAARTVGFALACASSAPSRFHGMRAGRQTLMIGCGDDIDLTLAPDCMHLGIVVDAALLPEFGRGTVLHACSRAQAAQLCVDARPGHATALVRQQLRLMRALARDGATLVEPARQRRVRDALLLAWMDAMPAGADLDAAAPKALHERRAIVAQVCELAAPALEPPPTLLAVCRRLGISPRKLEYCFHEVLGMSPRQYLRAARLNGVRRALQRDEDGRSIADIASHWGFWHMSDFAADYRRLFGELPSQTARQARRRPHEPARPGAVRPSSLI